jgi:hypothetical protein
MLSKLIKFNLLVNIAIIKVTGKSSYYLNVHKISLMGFMKAGLIYPIV